jgi:hypothetical protein
MKRPQRFLLENQTILGFESFFTLFSTPDGGQAGAFPF